MEAILAQAVKVAEEAEVFSVTSEETQVKFEANRLKHLQTKQQTSAALRVIKQGKIGYATTTGLDNNHNLVSNAVETARFGMPARFQLPASSAYPEVEVFDDGVESVPIEEMIRLGEELVTAVTAHTPGIVCEAQVIKGVISVGIINSRGGRADYRKSFFSLGVEGSLINGTDMLFVGESDSSCHPLSDSRAVSDVVLRQLDLSKNRAAVPSKSMPVVFTPNGVASALVSPLVAAFNGKVVLEGASPVGNRLGQTVFDRKLWLQDDPTLIHRPGSRPCDDEGVPSQRTPLVEQGTVTNFLYDLQTAALAHTRSTGNGGRNRGGLPAPTPSAFTIAPGSTTFDEMIRDIKEGLVIEYLMGAEQGNVLGGEFSGNVLLGYKVESGKIVGRVKDTMVSGNVYQLLKDIAAIGSETRWVGSFLQTPHLYFPSLSVAAKG
ncbi:MAG TPA: metallopeptidase TldD-related protein [Dehalococcoidales bacterium]|nr:metallopeptidase TldD-related protein [Dehalococcoidales bacterium]